MPLKSADSNQYDWIQKTLAVSNSEFPQISLLPTWLKKF